jgi:hypothetical protein
MPNFLLQLLLALAALIIFTGRRYSDCLNNTYRAALYGFFCC